MTTAKALLKLKVIGEDRVLLDEVKNRFSVEEGANIVANDVILQVQNGGTYCRTRYRNDHCCIVLEAVLVFRHW
jgi:hypothetical protein